MRFSIVFMRSFLNVMIVFVVVVMGVGEVYVVLSCFGDICYDVGFI